MMSPSSFGADCVSKVGRKERERKREEGREKKVLYRTGDREIQPGGGMRSRREATYPRDQKSAPAPTDRVRNKTRTFDVTMCRNDSPTKTGTVDSQINVAVALAAKKFMESVRDNRTMLRGRRRKIKGIRKILKEVGKSYCIFF